MNLKIKYIVLIGVLDFYFFNYIIKYNLKCKLNYINLEYCYYH